MSCIRTIALACSTLLPFAIAVSLADAAAPEAPTATPAAAPQTVTPKAVKTTLKMAANETIIYVGDLHCKHCAKKIASKLYTVKGVVKVRTDLKADVAIVTPQSKKKLDPLALWKAAQTSGFPAVKLVGPAGTYLADPKTKAAQLQPKSPVVSKS
jgi:copper chaperone CopZ